MEDSTGVVGCFLGGFVFCFVLFCGWNEERKVGERHGGERGTDTDNTEKPGRTVNYTS